MIDYTKDTDGIAIISFNMTDSPVNVLNAASISAFEERINEALADKEVKGIIITSGKKDFIVGADLKLIFSLNDPESLDNLESWIDLIGKEELDKKSVVLIGTKSDLPIKVDQDQLWDFRKKYRIENYFETSAVTGKNVHKVFEELAEQLSYTIHENEIFN